MRFHDIAMWASIQKQSLIVLLVAFSSYGDRFAKEALRANQSAVFYATEASDIFDDEAFFGESGARKVTTPGIGLLSLRGSHRSESSAHSAGALAISPKTVVWIPSWPRSGSTTIFSMVLAATKTHTAHGADQQVGAGIDVSARQCEDYVAGGGCEWTSRWSCPNDRQIGTEGPAAHDDSAEFNCCCERFQNQTLREQLTLAGIARRTSSNNEEMLTRDHESDNVTVGSDTHKHFGLFEPCHSRLARNTFPDIVDADLANNCKLNMERLFDCNFSGVNYLWGWRRPHTDISGISDDKNSEPPSFNQELARKTCSGSDLVVYKTVAEFGRDMDEVVSMLNAHPMVYAVVPIRDPRAIYSSWKELHWEFEGTSLLSKICATMAKGLAVHHPRLSVVVFEDLVMRPKEVTSTVLDFLGLGFGQSQEAWVNSTFNAHCSESDGNNGKFRTCHEDSLRSLSKWRKTMSDEELKHFVEDDDCQKVADHYNFKN